MATQLGVYQDALRLLGDVRLGTLTDDVSGRYALDDAFADVVTFLLRQAPWRFAMKETVLSTAGAGSLGFDWYYTKPVDWLRTHALFLLEGSREVPVDVRDIDSKWYADDAALYVRYVSTSGQTEANWTEQFANLVAVYLAYQVCERVTSDPTRAAQLYQLYEREYVEAVRRDALPENPWLHHQLTGSFQQAAQMLLEKGFWRFALKDTTFTGSGSAGAFSGFDYSHSIPADHLRTLSIVTLDSDGYPQPVDAREHAGTWSTDVQSISVRYVSDTAGLNPRNWPEGFTKTLAAYLGIEPAAAVTDGEGRVTSSAWPDMLAAALSELAVPPDPWLPHQLSGQFRSAVKYIIQKGFWRFSLKSASLTSASGTGAFEGYSYAHTIPSDHIRTQSILVNDADSERHPVDAREHTGKWSSNVATIVVRYLSSSGLDATTWPEQFKRVVAAYLGIEAAALTADEGGQRSAWPELLASALRDLAIPEDPWLEHQLSGAFRDAALALYESAFWRWGVKSASLVSATGTGAWQGFTYSHAFPTDHVRTLSIHVHDSDGNPYPVDVREHASTWSTDKPTIAVQYLAESGLTSTEWPEEFEAALAARLGIGQREGSTPWTDLFRKAAEDHAIEPDPWLAKQLSGEFTDAARYVYESAFWRFGIKGVSITSISGSGAWPGYSFSHTFPVDHVRTYSLHLHDADGSPFPVDVREHAGTWSTDVATIAVQYLAESGLDPLQWPEQFQAAVAARLGIGLNEGGPTFQEILAKAAADLALAPDPWLPHQLDGSFLNASETILTAAFWRFALKSSTLSVGGGTALPGYTYQFAHPADHLRTHSIVAINGAFARPIDAREHGTSYSAQRNSITVRYTSSDGLSPLTWPESFERVVAAYLDIERAAEAPDGVGGKTSTWRELLERAKAEHAVDPDPWLPAQLDGSFAPAVRYLLGMGQWRFAMKTTALAANLATPSAGFDYAFDKPADHLRTIWLYEPVGDLRRDIEFRDEGGDLHANFATPVLRYVSSTLGEDENNWSELFLTALQAYLAWRRAIDNPGTPGAVLQAREQAWKKALNDAQIKDDAHERPKVDRRSRLITARGGGYDREQAR